MRVVCARLPEAYEEQAWTGRRWRIRKNTVCHVFAVDTPEGDKTMMTFLPRPPALEALRNAGHPFFTGLHGPDVVGFVFDESTDWEEVFELLSDCYRIMAPKKLIAVLDAE